MSRHFPAGILGILVPVLLCIISLRLPEQSVKAQGGGTVVENEIMTYEEALQGTEKPMRPTAGSPLINAGTATAVRGLPNLIGPYLGNAPDAGAFERDLGFPWYGPRSFTNFLAYGLPTGWSVGSPGELGNFTSLGAPTSVAQNDFRLLLKHSNPTAFLLVTFEEGQGWNRYQSILGSSPIEFRDGLGASIVTGGGVSNLKGARKDTEGVLNVLGGVAAGGLGGVQDDFYTFMRSLWYGWYLQDPARPIALTFVTSPEPGVVPVGTAVTPSATNAVLPGILGGDVTITNASILWEVEGDEDKDATATVQFRRFGTSTWRDGFDLTRVKYQYGQGYPLRNNVTGSLFGLSPGTTYEVRVTLSDPDGGGETRTTTFTTRQMPKMPGDGRVIEVRPSDTLQTIVDDAQPGDTFLLHAGNYGEVSVRKSGTRERPILVRNFGDGAVAIPTIYVAANHVWLHGLTVNAPDNGYGIRTFDINNVPSTDIAVTGTTIQGNSGCCAWFVTRNVLFLDNMLIGPPRTLMPQPSVLYYTAANGANLAFRKIDPDDSKGGIVAFNESTGGFDSIKTPSRAYDIHGNKPHEQADDSIEPDYSYDNARIWENLAFHAGHHNTSFQPHNGGPWYFVRNQFTGAFQVLKMRGGERQYFLNNTFVSSYHTANSHYIFTKDSLFANNYWKALSERGGTLNRLGELNIAAMDTSAPRLWGYNRYDAHPCEPWHNGTLPYMQSLGAEKNTLLVNDLDGSEAAKCGGGGGGGGGNQPLTANAQTVIVRKNNTASITLSGSPSGSTLTFALGQTPSKGTLSGFDAATGKVTYTPNQGYEGNDSFSFTVSDGKATSAPGIVTLRIVESTPPDPAALVGHFKFDETSGVIASDSSSKNNDGVVSGGPAWVAGKIGGAIQFDGVDDYVRIADSNSLDLTKAMTISAWVSFVDASLGGNLGSFVVKSTQGNGGNAPPNETYALFVGGDTAFGMSDGDQTSLVTASRWAINDGRWHHVISVWDGTTNAGSQKLYVDGNEVASAASTAATIQKTTYDLFLNTSDSGVWGGMMDDTCIFSSALSPGEVLYLASGESCSGSTQAPSESVCLQIPLKNRLREARQDFAIAGTVEIRKSDGTIALSTVATPGKDGTLRITDASLLGNLDTTTSYTVSIKPRSHQRRVLRNVTTLKDGVCRLFPGSVVGDFNADGKITLADLVRAIKHFQKSDDAVVAEAYAGVRPSLATLVDILRNVITRGGEDE